MNRKINLTKESLITNIKNFNVTEIGEANTYIEFNFEGNDYFYELFSLTQYNPVSYRGKIYGRYKPRTKDQMVYLFINDHDMSIGKQTDSSFDVIGSGKNYLIQLVKNELNIDDSSNTSLFESEIGISLDLLRKFKKAKYIYTVGILPEHLKEYLQKHEGDKEAIEDIILDWDLFIIDAISKTILFDDKDASIREYSVKPLSEYGKTLFVTKEEVLNHFEQVIRED